MAAHWKVHPELTVITRVCYEGQTKRHKVRLWFTVTQRAYPSPRSLSSCCHKQLKRQHVPNCPQYPSSLFIPSSKTCSFSWVVAGSWIQNLKPGNHHRSLLSLSFSVAICSLAPGALFSNTSWITFPLVRDPQYQRERAWEVLERASLLPFLNSFYGLPVPHAKRVIQSPPYREPQCSVISSLATVSSTSKWQGCCWTGSA